MRSVVLSIAVHALLGAAVMIKRVVATAEPAPIAIELVAPAPPRPIEVEIYVEPSSPPTSRTVGDRAPAPRAVSGRAVVATTMPTTSGSDSPAVLVAAPHVVTLPSPDAAATTFASTTNKIEHAQPMPNPSNPSTFRMRVEPDGTAHLTDRRNFQWGHGGSTAYIEEHNAERWLEEHHEQSNAVDMKLPPLQMTVASFDLSDAAMRIAGQDPYAYEKLKALDSTRDERAQIGARHRERQLLDTPTLVRESLAEIERLPADRRAAAIRELYLDCDDSPAGEVARATIANYVRAQGLAIDLQVSARP